MRAGKRAASLAGALGLAFVVWAGAAGAEAAFVQIEALPTLDQAEGRLRALSEDFPAVAGVGVAGFALAGGWYGITLGPYPSAEVAEAALRDLRREGRIPRDSYIADPAQLKTQFWPVGAGLAAPQKATPPAPEPQAATDTQAATETPQADTPPTETLAQSQQAEAALSREGRVEIQSALQWLGIYTGGLDGAFGRGTRAAISAWQETQGVEPTGVLTTDQRRHLLDTVATERAALGITPVDEPKAGIAIDLPLGLVEFDHYDPPFVHYREKNGSGVRVLLISQPGDQNALFGLYDAMQTLEIVPTNGPRERSGTGFTLVGEDARIHSVTQATLSAGLIKGFTLVYPADQGPRMTRVLEAMKASFKPTGETALDPTLGQPMAVGRAQLLAGLDVRHPEFARSGFFITAEGAVLTAAQGLAACGRLTIEDLPARLAFADDALGVAVVVPQTPPAPPGIARFETEPLASGTPVAVAGFSYPEALSAPVLSLGSLSALSGLAEEPEQARLALTTLPGDVGGPVLDGAGAVLGVVLPRAEGGARIMPPDMTVAVQTQAIAPMLAAKGFAPTAAEAHSVLATEDIAALAQGFTVQVACWK